MDAFDLELRETLAEHLGLPQEQVAVGRDTAGFVQELLLIDDPANLLVLPSPSVPNGDPMTTAELAGLMEQIPDRVTVLIDETQLEYPDDAAHLISTDAVDLYPNLVVLRSYTKAYGMAGVRVFYAFGPRVSSVYSGA